MKLNVLWDNFFTTDSEQSENEFLREIPLFDSLKNSEIVRLERNLHIRKYKENETIFAEGEPGAALYIIKKGFVNIYKMNGDDKILLVRLLPGNFFGELALFDESPRSATAIATKESTLYALSQADLAQFSEKNPDIGFKISMRLGGILSQRLRMANTQIEAKNSDV